jgi:hypothetical protein
VFLLGKPGEISGKTGSDSREIRSSDMPTNFENTGNVADFERNLRTTAVCHDAIVDFLTALDAWAGDDSSLKRGLRDESEKVMELFGVVARRPGSPAPAEVKDMANSAFDEKYRGKTARFAGRWEINRERKLSAVAMAAIP